MANEATLTARVYGVQAGDYQLVNSWWKRTNDGDLPEVFLPPLGVMIERDGIPSAALWCYECFGIGVCFLEYPCAVAGLALSELVRVFGFAVDACVKLAKQHGDYSLFRCSTLPTIARVLPKLGFVREHGGHRVNFMLRRD